MLTPASQFVRTLVDWYAHSARAMPWRADPTPYKVLLSELMCQQTRVETAIPYFHRFIDRWPTLDALAAASEEDVLGEWAGLGYYSRARNLLAAARAAVAQDGLPSDVRGLRSLPGIGPYTAGAIASIAFGTRAALVDGNVERVLSRLDAREEDPRSSVGKKALWARAEELHASWEGHPGDLNQALMELGATVCTPRRPACPTCPVRETCRGLALGTATTLPRKAKKKPPVPTYGATGILRRGGKLVLARRSPGGLLGGLWEPLRVTVAQDEDPASALVSGFESHLSQSVRVVAELGAVVHVFSHRRLSCRVFLVEATRDAPLVASGDYCAVAALDAPDTVGLSALARKVLALAEQPALPLAASQSPVYGLEGEGR